MNQQQQQAVVRLGNRLFADAVGAAEAAADGISGHAATAAYFQLAGVVETMQAVGLQDSDAARHCGGLIQQLNERNRAYWCG